MFLRAVAPQLLSFPAFAHELPGPHTHPHGDWSGLLALLLGAGALSALFLLQHSSNRHSKNPKHDSR
jgi:hypothetical protein